MPPTCLLGQGKDLTSDAMSFTSFRNSGRSMRREIYGISTPWWPCSFA